MKKIILILIGLLLVSHTQSYARVYVVGGDSEDQGPVVTNTRTYSFGGNSRRSYQENYQKGYKEGYTYTGRGLRGISPIPPIAPIPNVGESEGDAYTRGILEGQRAKQRNRW